MMYRLGWYISELQYTKKNRFISLLSLKKQTKKKDLKSDLFRGLIRGFGYKFKKNAICRQVSCNKFKKKRRR